MFQQKYRTQSPVLWQVLFPERTLTVKVAAVGYDCIANCWSPLYWAYNAVYFGHAIKRISFNINKWCSSLIPSYWCFVWVINLFSLLVTFCIRYRLMCQVTRWEGMGFLENTFFSCYSLVLPVIKSRGSFADFNQASKAISFPNSSGKFLNIYIYIFLYYFEFTWSWVDHLILHSFWISETWLAIEYTMGQRIKAKAKNETFQITKRFILSINEKFPLF